MLTRRKPVSIIDAQKMLTDLPLRSEVEEIPVSKANHRIVAQDILAPFDYPHFRRSGYDGYAIRSEDDHDYPKIFKVVGNIPAGATFDQPLGKNETTRIMTGAFVPDNAGKVIMLEQTREAADPQHIKIMVPANHSNITEKGTEFAANDVLIKANTELNPGGLAILTALGIQTVPVYRQPKIAIITTGTELIRPNEKRRPGKIYNSNGILIENLVKEHGGVVTENRQLVDDASLLKTTLKSAIAQNDIVITDGGVSVGDYDFLAVAALKSDKLLFNKLRMRPGSVTTAFVQDQTLVMALSGNPGACFTAFYLYVEPLLSRFVHRPSRVVETTATLVAPYHKTNGFDRILRGTITQTDHGYEVVPNGSDKSGDLGNLQTTTCLFEIPHSNTPIALNTEVKTWLLPFK